MITPRGIDAVLVAAALALTVLVAAGALGGGWRWVAVAPPLVLALAVAGRSAGRGSERDDEVAEGRLGEVLSLSRRRVDLGGIVDVAVFDDAITYEVRRARRTARAVSVIVAELDGFTDLDRRHGQGATDEALRQVGELMRSSAREIDIVAEIPAGRFGILLPETEGTSAALVAERLRTAIARWSPQSGVPLTASFGVAGWVEGEDVLAEAEEALLRACEQGRDCVVLAGDDDLAS